MLRITLRDLQFRRRQFAIAVVGAALVFGLALVLTGVSSGFRTEARDTVEQEGGDVWLVAEGSTGPFTSEAQVRASDARRIARGSGVERATPFTAFSEFATLPGGEEENVAVVSGRREVEAGTALVSTRLDVEEGETLTIAGRRLTVAGDAADRTLLGGIPAVYVALADAQQIAYRGADAASAIVVAGDLARAPAGYRAMTPGAVEEDMRKPLESATSTIDLLRILMWIVAAIIIGAVTYLSALERLRDFAVLKAVGGESRALALSLALEAVLAALLAAVLGMLIAELLRPGFPVPVDIQPSSYVAMPVVAVIVGVLASLAALRRVLRVDPALAFG